MVHMVSLSVIIMVFSSLGLFGNVNIIWATYRKPKLRRKHGLLLANLAGYHIVCLASQWVNLSYSLKRRIPQQDECFKLILPYTFAISAQAMMHVVIVGDMLAAIIRPLRHRCFPSTPYVIVVSIPVWTYSVVVLLWGAMSVEEKRIMFCNPTLALNGSAKRFWLCTNLAIAVAVVVLHAAVWLFLREIGNEHADVFLTNSGEQQLSIRRSVWRDQKKAMESLSVHLMVFLLSWCAAIVGIELFDDFFCIWLHSDELIEIIQSYMVVFALLCYSQSYYILMWRAPEYTAPFKEQLHALMPSCMKQTWLYVKLPFSETLQPGSTKV